MNLAIRFIYGLSILFLIIAFFLINKKGRKTPIPVPQAKENTQFFANIFFDSLCVLWPILTFSNKIAVILNYPITILAILASSTFMLVLLSAFILQLPKERYSFVKSPLTELYNFIIVFVISSGIVLDFISIFL